MRRTPLALSSPSPLHPRIRPLRLSLRSLPLPTAPPVRCLPAERLGLLSNFTSTRASARPVHPRRAPGPIGKPPRPTSPAPPPPPFRLGKAALGSRHARSLYSSGAYVFLYLVVAVGALAVTRALYATPSTDEAPDTDLPSSILDLEMDAQPGRPGNLTPEEEDKLRKLWELYLQTCGVGEEEFVDAPTTQEPPKTASLAPTDSSDKPKKKRMGLFKKKDKKDKDAKSSEVPNGKVDDKDDKYGEQKAYQDILAQHSPEEIRSTIWSMVKCDNPDALLLRFLRARKWDVQKAHVMLMATMHWRATEMHVDDDIMTRGEALAIEQEQSDDFDAQKAGQDFLVQLRQGKSFCHGIDKEGRPISIVRARLHRAGEQLEENLERYTVYLIETSRLMLTPPADTACVIFDLSGFSLANMDYTPVKFIIKCFEANYPESLGVVLVHKAPWVFQGIWKIIRGWLDPVVASKVNFTNNAKDMEQFVDLDHLPIELDGKEDWTYEYVEPVAGENAPMEDTATRDRLLAERENLYDEWEQRTLAWIVAGAEDNQAELDSLRKQRLETFESIRAQYWRLDPYIRARSFYDRLGVIRPDGKVDYYPKARPAPATNGNGNGNGAEADDVD